jgi:hypothetical protein
MSIITISNFDVKKLSVSDIKKLDNGASQVYLNYDGKRVRAQAPRMPIPYDSGDYQGNQKFKVQFSFRDRTSNPKVQAYFNMIDAIDNFVIDQGVKNAGKWFKMPGASREMISLFFSPSLKYSKDKEGNVKDYPPTQSIALKMRNGAFDAEIYDNSKHLIEGMTPVEVLRRGAEVTPVSDATGIWVSDKKFGITWKLHQAIVNVPGEGGVSGCLIVDDDEDAGVVVAKPAKTAKASAVSLAEEEDLMAAVLPSASASAPVEEEEEDEEEEEEVIQAPPVPAKKAAPAPAAAPAAAPAVKKVVKKVTKA